MVLRKDFKLGAWIAAWTLGVKQTWGEERPNEVVRLLSIADSAMFAAPEEFPSWAREAWSLFGPKDPDGPELRAAVALAYIILSAIESKPAPTKGR